MRDTWKTAKVGLMIVAGLVAAWGVYRYVDEQAGDKGGYTVYALFGDAQGLIEKSRVVIAGIPVGYIEDISLQGAKARVDIHINEGIELHEDARVAMESVSILGEAILVISPGSKKEPLLHDGDQIMVVEESVSTDELLKTANDIAENIKSVTEQLDRSFGTDEAGDRMSGALEDLSEALDTINRTLDRNEENINEALDNIANVTDQGGDSLLAALENVERVTEDVREIMDNNKEGLDTAAGEVDDTVASIHRASERVENVLADAEVVTDRLARGEGTLGRLSKDETLIDEVEGAAEGINSFVGGISRLQTIVELRSEYNILANTFKSYVSLRIQPREDRYYLIQIVDDPRGLTEVSQTTIRTSPSTPESPPFQQVTKIKRSRSLRFSFMFAKRINFATFRFGILESTGGLGADFHLFDDSLELTADMFQIGEQTFPRLRIKAAYEVVKRFWVLAGVDDILNGPNVGTPQTGGRDFFLGMMLRFNDEDLKTILPVAGGAVAGAASGG